MKYQRTFTTTCLRDLIAVITADGSIIPTPIQIINLGDGDVIFDFASTLSPTEETSLDALLGTWTCPDDVLPDVLDEFSIDDPTPAEDNFWTSEEIVNQVNGKIIDATFVYHANTKNRWLSHESSATGLNSDVVPYVVPWDCELISITFTNQYDNVDTDVQIWKSGVGLAPDANKILAHTWELRDVRLGVHTDFGGSPPTFARGDRIGVYMKDRGTDPFGVAVKMLFRMTSGATANITDNVEENF